MNIELGQIPQTPFCDVKLGKNNARWKTSQVDKLAILLDEGAIDEAWFIAGDGGEVNGTLKEYIDGFFLGDVIYGVDGEPVPK